MNIEYNLNKLEEWKTTRQPEKKDISEYDELKSELDVLDLS